MNLSLCIFRFHSDDGIRFTDVFVKTHLIDQYDSFDGSHLLEAAVKCANEDKSGVFKFDTEKMTKLRENKATLFLRMRNGGQFSKRQFKALQQEELMAHFEPDCLQVEFDVLALDNHIISPVDPDEL